MLSSVPTLPGQTVVEGEADLKTQMMDTGTGQVVSKPTYSVSIDKTTVLADGVDEVSITGLPVGSTVRVSGPVFSTFDVDDGQAEISFIVAGEYHVSAYTYLSDIFSTMVTAS